MDVVFESIVLIGVGLLAITVAVFVLAVSLLGRAISASALEQEREEGRRKTETDAEVNKLKSELDKGNDPKQVKILRKRLQSLEHKQSVYAGRVW